MHSTTGPLGTTFHHNGDFSGEIKFSGSSEDAGRHVDVEAPFSELVRASVLPGYWASVAAHLDVVRPSKDDFLTVEVPVADLRSLVAGRVRDERISALEEIDDEGLFTSALASEIAAWQPGGAVTLGPAAKGVPKVKDPTTQWFETGINVRLIDAPSVYGVVVESFWNLGVCDVHFRQSNGQNTMAPQHYLEECTEDGEDL